jgi:hypothetical protein
MFLCECRVAWQANGATPLCTASYHGHVECVRALLGGGAAINQAMVGCASSPRGLGVRGCVRSCVHAWVRNWLGALGWHTFGIPGGV